MALFVIDGVPGSGKTYYAVWYLLLRYFKRIPHLSSLQVFFYTILPFLRPDIKPKYVLDKDCVIITNIDELEFDHVDLKAEIKEAGDLARLAIEQDSSLTPRQRETQLDKLSPVAEFFSKDYQEVYRKRYPAKPGGEYKYKPIVYIVDEAQTFFRRGMDRVLKERRVFDYFEWHRHWGHSIFLVTQNVKKLPPDIVYLPEYIVSAIPRSRSIGIGFKYNWISSGQIIKTETLAAKKEVFSVYQSMEVAETDKISNPMIGKIIRNFLFAGFIIFFGIKYLMARWWQQDTVPPADAPAVSSLAPLVPGLVHNSFIPVGETRKAKPPPRYVVFVPLDSITHYVRNSMQTLYVWRGRMLPADLFPHETLRISGQLYAVLDYELFDFMFGDSEDRPTDFIVQLAAPEEHPSNGDKANTRQRRP